ncbi:nitroreductase family protein [Enterococcus saccharolyticus]|uniref:nitroreductase family protein n=1 Tax=Enterococcus saccharolyticus TaxID=41997 RepID=UPI001E539385|nr:nitroreductase family protein [Enterococcus saccharolyticus]MCD5002257.1 nitroreductase family protein [Enterococcus saccharolyticus]
MNDTLKLLQNHRSYRNFDEKYQISEEELQQILTSARQAPSWMNGQMYSILVIKNKKIRQQLVEWNPGNPHILKSSVFLLFLADLKRTQRISERHHVNYPIDEGLHPLIIATTDASLALQNAIIASESLGLGVVPVGSVRNNIEEISELLHLPDYVYPVAGLSIGKPIVDMKVKPRLPEAAVVHYDTYKPYEDKVIDDYEQTMLAFGEARETKPWTKKFADYFESKPASNVDRYLKKQKLIK